jgi:hypothetical protein
MQFEWDNRKALINYRKHGVSFEEAKSCFYNPHQIAFYDSEHSEDEDREILVGHSNRGRLLMVICTIRSDKIRIISARKATQQEVIDYEKGI